MLENRAQTWLRQGGRRDAENTPKSWSCKPSQKMTRMATALIQPKTRAKEQSGNKTMGLRTSARHKRLMWGC